jgi:hypothetical protein
MTTPPGGPNDIRPTNNTSPDHHPRAPKRRRTEEVTQVEAISQRVLAESSSSNAVPSLLLLPMEDAPLSPPQTPSPRRSPRHVSSVSAQHAAAKVRGAQEQVHEHPLRAATLLAFTPPRGRHPLSTGQNALAEMNARQARSPKTPTNKQ